MIKKELEKDNLYQDVKYKLESRNIEYLHKTKTNLLNGVTISSDPEFFITLDYHLKKQIGSITQVKKMGKIYGLLILKVKMIFLKK